MSFHKAPHRKVRTGCMQCKRRRIKCDEEKPQCLNCVRYASNCSFEERSITPSQTLENQTLTALTAPPIFINNSEFSFADFELIHHWTISTAESLASTKALQEAMRDVVPHLAMEQNYLMHALMSLSALHISRLRQTESSQYLLKSATHHAAALPLIRLALTRITEDNCHALYACGHIILKYELASVQPLGSLVFCPKFGEVAQFLPLVRGAFSIHDHSAEWLALGPLGSCLETPLDGAPDLHQNPNDPNFAHIFKLLQARGTEDAATCCTALNQLRTLLAMVAVPDQTMSTKTLTFSWLARVSEEYITLMSERKPEALLVLAHYCIMLKMIDSFWFMKGCAARILNQCRKELSEEWQPYLSWPLFVIGLE